MVLRLWAIKSGSSNSQEIENDKKKKYTYETNLLINFKYF